jgi:hypothetical protein
MAAFCSKFFVLLALAVLVDLPAVIAASPSAFIGPVVNESGSLNRPEKARELTLDFKGDVVYKPGNVLGENTFSATPSSTFVFSGDKYELQNEGGQIKVSTFQLKESSTAAQSFELPGTDARFEISTQGEGFSLIEDGEVVAKTDLPLAVKKNSRSLWIVTPTGEKEIRVTPLAALKKLVRGGILTKVELNKKEVTFDGGDNQNVEVIKSDVQITDSAAGAYYIVSGSKEVKFIGLIPLNFNVKAKVDVESGRVIDPGTPWPLQYLGFLFSRP